MPYKFTQGDAEWHRLRKLALEDLYWFDSVVLDYSKVPMHEHAHRGLCRVVEGRTGHPAIDERHVQRLELPRDWGKTTCVTQGRPIQLICGNPNISILLFNEKEQNVKDFLAAIKWQFENNEFLRALFPEVIPDDFNSTTWSASRIVVKRTTGRKEPTIFINGVGAAVAGMHPDVIFVDDMISRDAMENARAGSWQIMHQTNRWINQLRPLISKQYEQWRIYFIGTRWWHGDSYDHIDLAYGYKEEPTTYNLRIPLPSGEVQILPVTVAGDLVTFKRAAIENGRSSFPEKWSLEDLARMRLVDEALFACFPPEQLVLTQRGHTPIVDVQPGDRVRNADGTWDKVKRTVIKSWQQPLRVIRTWGMPEALQATHDHELWATKAVRYRNWVISPRNADKLVTGSGSKVTRTLPKPSWLPAAELTVGDVLWTPIERAECWPVDWPEEFRHPDIWFLIGHWIGDGSLSINRKYPEHCAVSHVFNPKDRALAEKIQSILRDRLGRKATIGRSGATIRLGYAYKALGAFLMSLRLGKNSHKLLPAWAEQIPLECQRELIAGYWSADGCLIKQTGRRVAVSVCLPLLDQLQRILARFDETSYISKTAMNKEHGCRIHGKVYQAQQLYSLTRDMDLGGRAPKMWIDGDWLCRRIRSVEERAYEGPVHTLEARGSYTLANNTLVKNCNMMNNPSDERTSTFKGTWLQTHTWLDDRNIVYTDGAGKKRNIAVADLDVLFFVDPGGFSARSAEDRARPAVAVVGDDRAGMYHILDIYNEKDTYLAAIQQIVAWITRYQPRKIYTEQAGQQAAFAQLLREEIRKAGLNTVVDSTTLKPGVTQKDIRILALEPYFQRGQFTVGTGAAFHTFREQYTQFPRTVRKDVLDVLAYVPRIVKPRAGTNQSRSAAARQEAELATYRARRGISASR